MEKKMKNYAKVHESFESFSEFVEKLTLVFADKEKDLHLESSFFLGAGKILRKYSQKNQKKI